VADRPVTVLVTNFELLHVLAGHEMRFTAEDGATVAVRLAVPEELLRSQRAAAAGLPGPAPHMTLDQAIGLCQPFDIASLLRGRRG
jgi:hypothetical protein